MKKIEVGVGGAVTKIEVKVGVGTIGVDVGMIEVGLGMGVRTGVDVGGAVGVSVGVLAGVVPVGDGVGVGTPMGGEVGGGVPIVGVGGMGMTPDVGVAVAGPETGVGGDGTGAGLVTLFDSLGHPQIASRVAIVGATTVHRLTRFTLTLLTFAVNRQRTVCCPGDLS